MGLDVGTPYPRKNSEVGTDSESNAYHIWTGADQGVYMSRSTDSGNSWEENSIRISPAGVISSVFPHIDAGRPRKNRHHLSWKRRCRPIEHLKH